MRFIDFLMPGAHLYLHNSTFPQFPIPWVEDKSYLPVIAAIAKGYAELLRGHIDKEDNILYPLAERVLPEEVRSGMLLAYDNAEAQSPGLEEKYRQMVEDYAQQGAKDRRSTGGLGAGH